MEYYCPLCAARTERCRCGTTPALPALVAPPPSTIAIRYGVAYCTRCTLAVAYCRCGTQETH